MLIDEQFWRCWLRCKAELISNMYFFGCLLILIRDSEMIILVLCNDRLSVRPAVVMNAILWRY